MARRIAPTAIGWALSGANACAVPVVPHRTAANKTRKLDARRVTLPFPTLSTKRTIFILYRLIYHNSSGEGVKELDTVFLRYILPCPLEYDGLMGEEVR